MHAACIGKENRVFPEKSSMYGVVTERGASWFSLKYRTNFSENS
jgi:hypothetical protein